MFQPDVFQDLCDKFHPFTVSFLTIRDRVVIALQMRYTSGVGNDPRRLGAGSVPNLPSSHGSLDRLAGISAGAIGIEGAALKNWPPDELFDLRGQADGVISFQMETDQFLVMSGVFENGVVKIGHLGIRSKRG